MHINFQILLRIDVFVDINSKNHKVRWYDEGRDYDGTPFHILGSKILDCQHGKDRKEAYKKKKKDQKSEKVVST